MSIQVSASQAPAPNVVACNERLSSHFIPTIWGDHFLSYDTTEVDVTLEQPVQELKEEVKRMLIDPLQEPSQQLNLIDDIQRLGVAYHFKNEIDEILKIIHDNYSCGSDDDLYTTALRFRLLRQQGYRISCDVFNKFKEGNEFKASLLSDVSGLLSLYEATHLRIPKEDILEDALAFSTTHLKSMKNSLSPALLEQVSHSLIQPLWKGIPRVETRYYLSIYPQRDSYNENLHTFAKLDFNLLQRIHQKELREISRWWKDLDVSNNFPFVRDRIVECYFCWVLAVSYEPQFSLARKANCKVTAVVSIIDDIYDNHGTFEELVLFTEAIQRWDICATESLPEYMKICYKAMLEVFAEIEEDLAKEGKLYQVPYVRDVMKNQAVYYFREAKWFHEKYVPTLEEYIALSVMSSGYPVLVTSSCIGLGGDVTQDSFDWLATFPKPLKQSAIIARIANDVVSHKFEQNRGHVASAVECYMKESGATEEEAKVELCKQVSDAWKELNDSILLPNVVSRQVLNRILYYTCTIDVVYKYGDGYTAPDDILNNHMAVTLIEQFEQNRGHVASAVECYMKESGATEEEAKVELCKQVSYAWKDLNDSILLPNVVSRQVLNRILYYTCTIDVVYKYGDGYTAPDDILNNHMAATLIEQVPI